MYLSLFPAASTAGTSVYLLTFVSSKPRQSTRPRELVVD